MEATKFTNDMQSLLRPGISFNANDAYPLIYETFIDKIEGKGEKIKIIVPFTISYN